MLENIIFLKLKHVKQLIEMFSEDEELEISLAFKDKETICPESGEIMPKGLYAYEAEYPEEGILLLDDSYEYIN
jgi:hypothetical protein